MHAKIAAIEYHLPEATLETADLAALYPDWKVEKLDQASGIRTRHIAAAGECASDLAVAAAEKLFASGVATREEIDYLLFCTESPDYLVPATACLIQHRLGLSTQCGAIDYNMAHSGYVYGLGLVEGLIASGQARNVLLLTGETYSKYIHERDKIVRTIFGDAGTATLLRVSESGERTMGPFVYGTDGGGAEHIMVPAGGARQPRSAVTAMETEDENGNIRSADHLRMNGVDVFSFTLSTVPASVQRLLESGGKSLEEVDAFVFHQSNRYILEHLRKRIGIPPEKFALAMERCGNTVSSSIPIALREFRDAGRVPDGGLIAMVGYGAGFSWGAALARW